MKGLDYIGEINEEINGGRYLLGSMKGIKWILSGEGENVAECGRNGK